MRRNKRRRTFKRRRGGSIFPFMAHDLWGNLSDSIRDSYNGINGNYPGIDSSITTQGKF